MLDMGSVSASKMVIATISCLAACTGSIGDNVTDPGSASNPTSGGSNITGIGGDTSACGTLAPNPGRSPLRRLNRTEYISTVSDLLGISNAEDLASSFPPDEQAGGFSNNADALVVTSLLAGDYVDVSEKIAAAAVMTPSKLVTCGAAETESACAARFIETFGKRAFRRPLDAGERSRYLALYTDARTDGSFTDGLSVLVRAFLQSPHFLYRVESGEAPSAGSTVAAVTPYELAARLSYALWGTMPSDELFAAADGGKLATTDGIEAEVRQMLTDDRAKRSIAGFHGEWLDIGGVTTVSKDPSVFPDAVWNATVQNDLRVELQTFVNETFWNDGHVETLLAAPYSFLNANLAKFYGVAPPSAAGFVRTALDPTERAGILTGGALMAFLASNNQTSPVHRGKFVREKILCQQLPAPPANLVIKVPQPNLMTSTRQRYTQHSADATCASCHRMMDPIGFGFENYDAIGAWRTKDGMFDVDASGEVVQTSDANGKFVGAVELAKRLSVSADVRSCAMTEVFRYAAGRAETEGDKCSLAWMNKRFTDTGYDMRELWVAVASSEAFRFRAVTGGGE
jgi:hypothetical protein